MRQVIDGKVYDEDTATRIGGADNIGTGVASWSDFHAWSAALYRTPRGRYFLAGEGGAMSVFSWPSGDGRTGGRAIIPMDKEQALEWAERNLDSGLVEDEFSEIIEEG